MLTLTVSQPELKPFLSKDSMRPVLKYVLLDFENGCFVATSGHVLIKHKITFNVDDLPENMPLKVVVPVEVFPKKRGCETLLRFDLKESTPDSKGNTYFFVEVISIEEYDSKKKLTDKRIVETIQETFPNYQAAIPEPLPEKTEDSEKWDKLYDQKAVQCIGVDWDKFKDISSFLANRLVKLSFNGQLGAVMINYYDNEDGCEDWEILVMPIRLKR